MPTSNTDRGSRWKVVEPGDDGSTVETIFTENDIIETFFEYWRKRMIENGLADQVSVENCIQDWVTVHWAERVS